MDKISDAPHFSKEWNKALVKKYPWMIPVNSWTEQRMDEQDPNYDYEFTYADDFLPGWWSAFGETFCEELDSCLKKCGQDIYKNFKIIELKEKFGGLRIYTNIHIKEVNEILDKYEALSTTVCQECGAPATRISQGWIGYFCEKCAPVGSKIKKDWYVLS